MTYINYISQCNVTYIVVLHCQVILTKKKKKVALRVRRKAMLSAWLDVFITSSSLRRYLSSFSPEIDITSYLVNEFTVVIIFKQVSFIAAQRFCLFLFC